MTLPAATQIQFAEFLWVVRVLQLFLLGFLFGFFRLLCWGQRCQEALLNSPAFCRFAQQSSSMAQKALTEAGHRPVILAEQLLLFHLLLVFLRFFSSSSFYFPLQDNVKRETEEEREGHVRKVSHRHWFSRSQARTCSVRIYTTLCATNLHATNRSF